MEFFKNIQQSIFSPVYYQTLLVKPFSYSIKYYLLLSLIVAFILTAIVSPQLVLTLKHWINLVNIANYYPADLEINITNGRASINATEPYFVKMPGEFNGGKFKNIMVVDTKNNFNIETFKSYNTFSLLTSDSLVVYNTSSYSNVNSTTVYDRNGKITIYPLGSKTNLKINKPNVESFVNKVKPYLVLVYPLVIVMVLVAFIILSLFRLVYFFFVALAVWLIAALKKVNIGYGKSYQLGMHLATMGILLDGLIYALSMFFVFWTPPFLFTIILIIMALIHIKKPVELISDTAKQVNPI